MTAAALRNWRCVLTVCSDFVLKAQEPLGREVFMADVLVSTDWAVQHRNDADKRFIEVDVDTTQYEAGHLPGAVAFNWQSQLQDPIARDIISKEGFEKLGSGAGIAPNPTVELFGANNNWLPSYAFWWFEYYGP